MNILERHRESMRAGAGKLIYDLSWPNSVYLLLDNIDSSGASLQSQPICAAYLTSGLIPYHLSPVVIISWQSFNGTETDIYKNTTLFLKNFWDKSKSQIINLKLYNLQLPKFNRKGN